MPFEGDALGIRIVRQGPAIYNQPSGGDLAEHTRRVRFRHLPRGRGVSRRKDTERGEISAGGGRIQQFLASVKMHTRKGAIRVDAQKHKYRHPAGMTGRRTARVQS